MLQLQISSSNWISRALGGYNVMALGNTDIAIAYLPYMEYPDYTHIPFMVNTQIKTIEAFLSDVSKGYTSMDTYL